MAEKRYFYIGFGIVICLVMYMLLLNSDSSSYLEYERDKTLRAQQEEVEEMHKQQLARGVFSSDNQPRSV